MSCLLDDPSVTALLHDKSTLCSVTSMANSSTPKAIKVQQPLNIEKELILSPPKGLLKLAITNFMAAANLVFLIPPTDHLAEECRFSPQQSPNTHRRADPTYIPVRVGALHFKMRLKWCRFMLNQIPPLVLL